LFFQHQIIFSFFFFFLKKLKKQLKFSLVHSR
jgi:hypothetical protein